MTRDEALRQWTRLLAAGETAEAMLGTLREQGFSTVDAIWIARHALPTGLAEAKELVHTSPAWASTRPESERLHDLLERAASGEPAGDALPPARRFDRKVS